MYICIRVSIKFIFIGTRVVVLRRNNACSLYTVQYMYTFLYKGILLLQNG